MSICSCCASQKNELVYASMDSIYSSKPVNVVRCLGLECSNVFTDPKPSESELNDIYSKIYMYPVHFAIMGEKKYRARKMAAYIARHLGETKGKKVLEIGCMYGYLLEALGQENIQVEGIELDKAAVEHCQKNGLKAEQKSVEEFVKEGQKTYDLVVLSHVLEHLREPEKILQQLKSLLNKDALLVVAVPNSSSINRKIFGRFWGWWQVPIHVNHFNPNSLKKLGESADYSFQNEEKNGGDSLMIMLNFINMIKLKGHAGEPGSLQKVVIKVFSFFARYWYVLGNEELVMAFKKRGKTS